LREAILWHDARRRRHRCRWCSSSVQPRRALINNAVADAIPFVGSQHRVPVVAPNDYPPGAALERGTRRPSARLPDDRRRHRDPARVPRRDDARRDHGARQGRDSFHFQARWTIIRPPTRARCKAGALLVRMEKWSGRARRAITAPSPTPSGWAMRRQHSVHETRRQPLAPRSSGWPELLPDEGMGCSGGEQGASSASAASA
jgi:hypothetical protein